MSEALHRAISRVPEASWEACGKADSKEIRECAEVDFVPGEKSEQKDTQPLRATWRFAFGRGRKSSLPTAIG